MHDDNTHCTALAMHVDNHKHYMWKGLKKQTLKTCTLPGKIVGEKYKLDKKYEREIFSRCWRRMTAQLALRALKIWAEPLEAGLTRFITMAIYHDGDDDDDDDDEGEEDG